MPEDACKSDDEERVRFGRAVWGLSTIRVSANLASSSLLSFDDNFSDTTGQAHHVKDETVRVTRLDELRVSMFGSSDRLFLKLDVQGLESSVIEGGRETFSR